MNRGSTFFLRVVVFLLGLGVLGLIGYTAYLIFTDKAGDYEPVLVGICYLAAIPYYIALHQTLKLLNYIDQNKPFSELSVKALRKVKLGAMAISGLYTIGMPAIFYIADNDDAPGVVMFALLIIGTSLVVATSAGVLQKLLQTAIDIKSENDLTV